MSNPAPCLFALFRLFSGFFCFGCGYLDAATGLLNRGNCAL